jgi:hypothetical protein
MLLEAVASEVSEQVARRGIEENTSLPVDATSIQVNTGNIMVLHSDHVSIENHGALPRM